MLADFSPGEMLLYRTFLQFNADYFLTSSCENIDFFSVCVSNVRVQCGLKLFSFTYGLIKL